MPKETLVTRRSFLGSVAAATFVPSAFAQNGAPIPVQAWNHMTLSVTDIARSLEFYQGLFGMTVAARQANTLILRIGNGPQFMALGGGRSDVTPSINHFCLTVNKFDHAALVVFLGQHGVEAAEHSGMSGGPLRVRIRQRGADFGGAPEGTPELYIGDPDGVVVQLQDTTYCGGEGVLGERCPSPEPSSRRGLIAVRDINHFTAFASDQQRSIAWYQELFGMPSIRSQGAMPLLSVGSGRQFLAIAQTPGPPRIHHACLTMQNFQHEEVSILLPQALLQEIQFYHDYQSLF